MSAFMDIPESNYAVSYERIFLCSAAATARLVYNVLNEKTDILRLSLYIPSSQKAGQEVEVAGQRRRKDRWKSFLLQLWGCGIYSESPVECFIDSESLSLFRLIAAFSSLEQKWETWAAERIRWFWVKEAKCWGTVSVNTSRQQERANADAKRWKKKNAKEGRPKQQQVHRVTCTNSHKTFGWASG